jgi:hypothetical protein
MAAKAIDAFEGFADEEYHSFGSKDDFGFVVVERLVGRLVGNEVCKLQSKALPFP